jgi:hypothetical protein
LNFAKQFAKLSMPSMTVGAALTVLLLVAGWDSIVLAIFERFWGVNFTIDVWQGLVGLASRFAWLAVNIALVAFVILVAVRWIIDKSEHSAR